MNRHLLFSTLAIAALSLSACGGQMPKLFWDVDEGRDQPAYAQNQQGGANAQARAPLDVPPELRTDMELPMAERVGADAQPGALPAKYQSEVAGKPVALDARVYEYTTAQVFSATVDAMTSLNLPVDSVDSPSGIVTSDWIRRGANNSGLLSGIFGAANTAGPTRHRFISRVYRGTLEGKPMSRLEIRVLMQMYENGHWVNKPAKQKVTNELFAAVEEQLAKLPKPAPVAEPAADGAAAEEPAPAQ